MPVFITSQALFALLKPLPKGAALHVHSDSMVDIGWLVATATYDPNLHVCGIAGGLDAPASFHYFVEGGQGHAAPPACTDRCPRN